MSAANVFPFLGRRTAGAIMPPLTGEVPPTGGGGVLVWRRNLWFFSCIEVKCDVSASMRGGRPKEGKAPVKLRKKRNVSLARAIRYFPLLRFPRDSRQRSVSCLPFSISLPFRPSFEGTLKRCPFGRVVCAGRESSTNERDGGRKSMEGAGALPVFGAGLICLCAVLRRGKPPPYDEL